MHADRLLSCTIPCHPKHSLRGNAVTVSMQIIGCRAVCQEHPEQINSEVVKLLNTFWFEIINTQQNILFVFAV